MTEEDLILLPPGVDVEVKQDSKCAKCGADKEYFRNALGGVAYCMKCGNEVKNG